MPQVAGLLHTLPDLLLILPDLLLILQAHSMVAMWVTLMAATWAPTPHAVSLVVRALGCAWAGMALAIVIVADSVDGGVTIRTDSTILTTVGTWIP